MKLFLTATSERGKPVTKSGNEYISIEVKSDKRVLTACFIEIMEKDADNLEIKLTAFGDLRMGRSFIIPKDNTKI